MWVMNLTKEEWPLVLQLEFWLKKFTVLINYQSTGLYSQFLTKELCV